MTFRSTKVYDHSVGLSCCFRQWRASSHCRFIHGYALAFTFVFEAIQLDERGWVVDFGGLGVLKDQLKVMFDHKLLVAKDDPAIWDIQELHRKGLAQVMVIDRVGCEAFAQLAWELAYEVLWKERARVKVVSCQVSEHGGNHAIYLANLGEG